MKNGVPKAVYLLSSALLILSFSGLKIAHSSGGVNPLNPGLAKIIGTDNINGASLMCISCHTLVPVTGKGSHFVGQPPTIRTTIATTQTSTERTAAWSGSLGFSKYGNYSTSPPISVTGVTGQLICESCHNLVKNVSGGNNLLEYSYNWDARPTQPVVLNASSTTTLCEGCHVTAVLPGHHPMTGDPVVSSGLTLSTADSLFTRGSVDNVQMASGNTTPGSEVIYPAANRMGCLSCHGNGHSGSAGTGARLLRRGWAGASSVAPLAAGSAVVGTAADGTQRQADKGASPIMTNWQPLCDSCHKVDD